jgi:hypothetical protein
MDEETIDKLYKLQKQIRQLETQLKEVAEESLKLARWSLNQHVTLISHINVIYSALEDKGFITREEATKLHKEEVDKYCMAAEKWEDDKDGIE